MKTIQKKNIPASIAAYNKFGLPRTSVDFMLKYTFHYPEQYKDTLVRYYKLYHKPEYFFSLLEMGAFYSKTDDMLYDVIYYKCTPSQLRMCKQIEMSFREAQPEFDLKPYVLVRGVE